jgi:TolB-like protein/class 3 adenylate cyclase
LTGEWPQRRLAAVLAADVAGYSRLMGDDEEGTLARLKAVRNALIDPAIASYRGRIVKTTGDGMLVEFASPVDATRCSVEVQGAIAAQNADVPQHVRIEFRIGIHVGDIMIDDNDIFGDGVNIAARLEGIAEPGGVCVSDDAYRQIRGKVQIVCDDLGLQTLKNIAEPMRAWRVRLDGQTAVKMQAGLSKQAPALALPDKPSVAVLAFQNMSGDPEQEYFADGMVEDIITALSRFKSLFVIARNSSFTYKGRAVDIKQVGRELGVRYVLEGSVRKVGGLVRITAQLIEAATGTNLWADRIDGSLESVFELQDNVARSVVGAVVPHLISADVEQVTRKSPDSWDGYDHYLRGLALNARQTLEGNRQAQAEFEKAISLDPDLAMAHVRAAFCVHNRFWGYLIPYTDKERTEMIRLTELALQIAPNHDNVLGIAAYIVGNVGREQERGLALADRSLDLNPNLAQAWSIKGYLSALAGDLSNARYALDQSIRLNPLDLGSIIGALRGYLTICFALGSDEVIWARKLIAISPTDVHALFCLCDVARRAGDNEEADRISARMMKLCPTLRKPVLREMYLRFQKPEHQAMAKAAIDRSTLPE